MKESLNFSKFELRPKLSKRDKEILFDSNGHSSGGGYHYDRAGVGLMMMLFLFPFLFIYNLIRFILWGIKELYKGLQRRQNN
jgi:hypothetical protein